MTGVNDKIIMIQGLAEKNRCSPSGDVAVTAGKNEHENFAVPCADGRRLQFACLFLEPVTVENGIPMMQPPGRLYRQPACWLD